MKTPKVSVIVPIYNVEKYIDKCLASIQNQTFDDFEVLLINDGTPDGSMEIAKKYTSADKRFRIYNKENGGLSDARNYGIARAAGDFIVLIDSDDFLYKDYLSVLYNACVENDADMAYCRYKFSYCGGKLNIPMPFGPKKGVLTGEKAARLLISDTNLQSYAWNKIYRRTLFTNNGITYPKMYFEDIATSSRLMIHANKVAISNRYLYYYVKRSGSIMATMNAKKVDDLMLSILIERNYTQRIGVYDIYKKAIHTVAKKMELVNIYSILRQHILNLDFRGFGKNLKINKKLYKYIVSDDYTPCDGFPELPYHIHQPGKKKKR